MELPKIDLKYLKEAFKEPINFWGMAGFAVAAAYVQDVTPLVAALATETLYLATVPASSIYRRLVDRREKQRLLKLREQQREAQIKLFDPREREAVEYLRWMKNQIYSNYKKFTGTNRFLTTFRVSINVGKISSICSMCIVDANITSVQSIDRQYRISWSRQSDRLKLREMIARREFNRRMLRYSNAVWLLSMILSVQ